MRSGGTARQSNALLLGECAVRQRCLHFVLSLIIAAITVVVPVAASAQSIVDILAPEAKDYPSDFKYPNKKCEDDCRKYLSLLNSIRKDLAKFDTPEWRDWAKADQNVKDKEAALKPFTDAQTAAKANLKKANGKDAVRPPTQPVTNANDAAKGPANEKKKADDELKKADDKLPKNNKSGDIKRLQELATEIKTALADLKACLEKCNEGKPPPPPPGETAHWPGFTDLPGNSEFSRYRDDLGLV